MASTRVGELTVLGGPSSSGTVGIRRWGIRRYWYWVQGGCLACFGLHWDWE